ncbi:MAG: NACHT domain-containing protein, partial [Chloroflexota bacterium]
LWQARLTLLYNRPEQAKNIVEAIKTDSSNQEFKAQLSWTSGNISAALNLYEQAEEEWKASAKIFDEINQSFNSYLVRSKSSKADGSFDQSQKALPANADQLAHGQLNRSNLLNIVEDAWVNGVLKNSLGLKQGSLDLPLDTSTHLPAGRLVAHQPDQVDQPVAGAQNLMGLFEASGRSLLILGAPGSGKTITLLQLLEQLIWAARADLERKIPLLFNLSSFGQFKGDFVAWLVDQAHDQYGLKREAVKASIDNNNDYIWLFDGLDEIPDQSGRRSQCVEQINHFMRSSQLPGLVICSRIKDYRELDENLELRHAVVIQPLTNQQIESNLESIGRNDLTEAAQTNWRLREALRSPLLINLLPQAVSPDQTESFAQSSFASISNCKQAILAAYAENILVEDSEPNQKSWLSFLATNMTQNGFSVFQIENLQPTWLPTEQLFGRYRWWSGFGFGALLGFIICLCLGLGLGLQDYVAIGYEAGIFLGLFAGIAVGIFLGLYLGILTFTFFGLAGGVSSFFTRNLNLKIQRRNLGAGISLLIAGVFATGLLLAEESELAAGLIVWLAITIGFAFSIGQLSAEDKISLSDRLVLIPFSWERLKSFFPVMLAIFLIFNLVGALSGPILEFGELTFDLFLSTFIEILPITSVTAALSWIGLTKIDSRTVVDRLAPGKGVRASLRNSLLMVLLAGIVYGLAGLILDIWYQADGSFLIFTLTLILTLTFTRFGGMSWSQHIALRFVLSRNNLLPFRLVPWLDKMAENGLLRKVGGSYIFRHRSLLEYFVAEHSAK